MPPKKKKPPPNKEDEGPPDIFAYIDLIQDCLDVAEGNESHCLTGISEADVALQQTNGDPDIQCIVQIKRAELLYIAVKNGYNVDELVGHPLDSCTEDCEQVLSKVSSANGGRDLYEKASSLLNDAKKLKKALQKEARAKRSQPKHSEEKASYSVFQRYDPTKALFKHVSKINAYLLQDVVECYKKSKNICRTCYYKHNRIEQLSVPNRYCKHCKKVAMPLLLIPASQMCDNLAGSQSVAIPPPPKMLMAKLNKHKPFQMCKNKDHTICCEKSAAGETWFGHSIEELVVWTVERHYGCKFSEYIRSHHKESESPNHKLFTEATNGSTYQLDDFNDAFESEREDDSYEYYPEECMYKNVAAIPQLLLLNVIELYGRAKEYCKWCFYKESRMATSKFDRSFNCKVCTMCSKKWDPVVVIPASQRCWNFGNFDCLPIGPWPKGKPIKDSFEYCQKKDHYRCFRVYIESEFWYPHSVEEMIVWTVERERGCSFRDFILSVSSYSPHNSPKTAATTTPTNTTQKTVSMTTPTKTVRQSVSPVPSTTPKKAHPLSVSPTPTNPASNPTLVQRTATGTTAVSVSNPVAALQSVSPWKATSLPNELQYSTAQAGMPQQGRLMNSTVHQTPVSPTQLMVTPIVNNNNNTTGNVHMYPPNTVQGLANVLKGTQNYISSIQEFQPTGTVQVTTVGLTIATSPAGVFGSAVITTSALSGSSGQYPMNFKMSPSYRTGSVTYEVQASRTPLPAVISPSSTMAETPGQVYKFLEVNFKDVVDIPVPLLKAISSCFKSKKEVCRLCFYEERVLSELVQATNTCANGGHPWIKPLLVIKGCTVCDNEPCFERGEPVPIPPLPPVATIKKCSASNHHKCYTKSLKSNEMFAHSVEALVVWIVESEAECSFEEYTARKLTAAAVVASPSTPTTRASSRTPPPSTSQPRRVSPAPVSPKISVPPKNTMSPQATPQTTSQRGTYHPKDVVFTTMTDIPPNLLAAVAECFKSRTNVCRVCFFDSGCTNLIQKVEVNRVMSCPYGHNPWREIKVIPSCELCVSPSEWIPVPPLPKHMKQSRNPFLLCKKPDHSICYTMSKGTNPWFPHTVEEMVIWTVERERDKLFEEVYQEFLPVYPPPSAAPPPATANPPSQLNRPGFMTTTQAQSSSFITTRTVSHSEPRPQQFIIPKHPPRQPILATPRTYPLISSIPNRPPGMTQTVQRTAIPPAAMIPNRPPMTANPPPAMVTNRPPMTVNPPAANRPPIVPQTASDPRMTANPSAASRPSKPPGGAQTVQKTATPPATKIPSQAKPTGVTQTQAPMSIPVQNPPTVTGYDIQSPTMKMDIDEAIKLAQSVPPKAPDQPAPNSMFEAFPNLLTNILPGNNETGSMYSNSLGFGSFGSMPDQALGGLFPALFGGSDGINLSSTTDLFANSGSLAGLGVQGKTPTTYELPVSTALHGWMSAPAPSGTGRSTDTQQPSNTNQNSSQMSQEPMKNVEQVSTSQSTVQSQVTSNSQNSVKPASPVTVPSAEAVPEVGDPLSVPRMPNSEPQVLEKAFEAEGFIKVKSKRQKKKVDPPSPLASQSKKTPKPQKVSKPKFTDFNLDEISDLDVPSGNSQVKASQNSHVSSSTGSSSSAPASREPGAVSSGAASQSSGPKQLVSVSNGFPTSNGASGNLSQQLSDTFEPQQNGVVSQVSTSTGSSSEDRNAIGSLNLTDSSFVCLVCYESFSDVKLLAVHCQTESHCTAVAMTTGGTKLPKYAPPHFNSERMKLCKKLECPGVPNCKRAHSQEQLASWKQEWALFRKSKALMRGVDSLNLPSPVKVKEFTGGLCLSQDTAESQYPGLVVSLSKPASVTVQPDQETVEWNISIQGQNWQTLFGVYCHALPNSSPTPSLSEPAFKVRSISSKAHTISINSPSWEADSMSGGLLLGSVEVCVVAWVASVKSGGKEKYELRLNLGFKEYLYLPVTVQVKGEASLPVHEGSQSAVDTMNNEPNSRDLAQVDPLGPFVPQHKWNLSHGSSSSEELGMLNIEGEDTTLQHVPIEDWGCSLTEDVSYLK